MLQFGAVALFATLTMTTAGMSAKNSVPAASLELGTLDAEIGAPAPTFTSCFYCDTSNNFTGPTLTATAAGCATATSDLNTALRQAATVDCQDRGYDNRCFAGTGGSFTVYITSACSTSSSGTSVSGYATYNCQFYDC
jgi:hypothetical protein